MKRFEETIKEAMPTLVVFEHVGEKDDAEMKTVVEEVAKEFEGKAKVLRVDVTRDGNIKERYKLTEYPAFILFQQGEELMRESGRKSRGDLEDMVRRALG